MSEDSNGNYVLLNNFKSFSTIYYGLFYVLERMFKDFGLQDNFMLLRICVICRK